MRKNIVIIALYILGMFAAVGPYLLIDSLIDIVDPYQIIAFIVTYATILVFLGYFIVIQLKKDFVPFFRRLKLHLAIIVAVFVLAYMFSIIANLILLLLGITEEAINQGGLIDMIRYASTGELIVLVLLFCLLVPIIEELVFRKAIYGIIKKLTSMLTIKYRPEMEVEKIAKIASISAVILSGLIFGIVHIQGDFIYLLQYGTAGILIGASYYISKENIYVPLTIHVLQNIVGVGQIIFLISHEII